MLGIVATVVLTGTISVIAIVNGVKNDKITYEKYLGFKQVVDGDTLTVVDYSIVFETFTLSNGTEVSFEFINTPTDEN